jgi:hypothetical protein
MFWSGIMQSPKENFRQALNLIWCSLLRYMSCIMSTMKEVHNINNLLWDSTLSRPDKLENGRFILRKYFLLL